MSHEVYKINCLKEDCELLSSYYMGQTQNSISRRMTEYLKNGVMKVNMRNIHINTLTRLKIVQNVSCIKKLDQCKKAKKCNS